jgi:cGMP-dependent protein kinase
MNRIYNGRPIKLNLSPLKSSSKSSTRYGSEPRTDRFSTPRIIFDSSRTARNRAVSQGYNSNKTRFSTKKASKLSIDYRNIDAATAVVVNKLLEPRDINFIDNILSGHFIFSHLANDQRLGLIHHMKYYRIHRNEVICYQGNYGNNLFIVDTGQVEVLVSNERKAILGPGGIFGDLALIQDSPRTATIKTIENTTLWGLDRFSFKRATQEVNLQNYEENKSFVESVPLFAYLTNAQKDALLECTSNLRYNPGDKIVREGDLGELFFIIKSGTASCSKNGRQLRLLSKGDFFGEQSLLYGVRRAATITALNTVRCLVIGRENLYKVVGKQLQNMLYRNTFNFTIAKSTILDRMNKLQIEKVFSKLTFRTYNKGDTVISSGEIKGHTIWFILKGKIAMRKAQVLIDQLSCIGEDAIVSQHLELFEDDYLAFTSLDCALISKQDFENCIGGEFSKVTNNNEAMEIIKKIPIFKSLSLSKINALTQVLKLQDYNSEEVIVEQGQLGYSFFIVKEGAVDVFRDDKYLKSIGKFDYFGERSIILNERRAATVVANGYVVCWYLDKQDFETIIDDNIQAQLLKRISFQNYTRPLDELVPIVCIGRGKYGNVMLVSDKINKYQYALKYFNKASLDSDMLNKIESSEHLFSLVDHPFIVKFVRSYADTNRIYFLEEFVKGVNLTSLMTKFKLVNEDFTRFHIACLICVLEHLHERDIVYRDLKPESIIIDDEGYPKLLNLESAKIVQARTFTIVGTPHYMAPEVISGKGYNILADYWSLGVIMFELLCGTLPYGEGEDDPISIYQSIIKNKMIFPSWVERRLSAKPLLEQFLHRNPASRIGGSVDSLKKHPWFNKIDWEAIYNREFPAPFIPETSNFTLDTVAALKSSSNLEVAIRIEEELLQSFDKKQNEARGINKKDFNWTSKF